MKNLVPLGTGNSRFMKSNIPASTTLAQLISMLNNGTFPYDVGTINPAGISQQGTPLNKATLLKDETAALYGLGTDAVPDDVLALLSKSALYKTVTHTAQLGTLPEGSIIYLNENGSPVPFYVAKQGYEPSYNTDRVLVVRTKPVQNGQWNSSGGNVYSGSTVDTWLNSDYLNRFSQEVIQAIGETTIEYVPRAGGVITVSTIAKSVFLLSCAELFASYNSYFRAEGELLPIADTLANDTLEFGGHNWMRSPYLDGSDGVGNWYLNPSSVAGSSGASSTNSYGYLPAFTLPTTFTAYLDEPTTGLYDISNNLLLKLPGVQIETGSYTGTGTYGSGNQNTLTFRFAPKVVFIYGTNSNYGYYGFLYPFGQVGLYLQNMKTTFNNASSTSFTVSYSENSLNWYSDLQAVTQMNVSGVTYHYTAIG